MAFLVTTIYPEENILSLLLDSPYFLTKHVWIQQNRPSWLPLRSRDTLWVLLSLRFPVEIYRSAIPRTSSSCKARLFIELCTIDNMKRENLKVHSFIV